MHKRFSWKTRRDDINTDFILRLKHNVRAVSRPPSPICNYIYLVVVSFKDAFSS
jgi:hypothetical protein